MISNTKSAMVEHFVTWHPIKIVIMSIYVLVGAMNQQKSSVCTTEKIIDYLINEGVLLTSSRRFIFDGPGIALEFTDKNLSTVK